MAKKKTKQDLIDLIINSYGCPSLFKLVANDKCNTGCKECKKQALNKWLNGKVENDAKQTNT